MYIVRVKGSSTIVAMCSRIEDANSYLHTGSVDKTIYVIEKMETNK